jgi:hypothetical protein
MTTAQAILGVALLAVGIAMVTGRRRLAGLMRLAKATGLEPASAGVTAVRRDACDRVRRAITIALVRARQDVARGGAASSRTVMR